MFAESSPSLVAYWGQMTRRGMDQSVVHFSTLIRKSHHAIMSLIIYFVFPAISVNINSPREQQPLTYIMHRMTDWGAGNLTQTHRRGGEHKLRQRHIHLHEILSRLLISVTRGPLGSWKCDGWQSLSLRVSTFPLRWEDKKDKAERLKKLNRKAEDIKIVAVY